MTNLFSKLKLYLKLLLFGAALIYLLLFLRNNRAQPAKVWMWFGEGDEPPQHSVLWYLFLAFVSGVVATIMTRMAVRTIRQVREMRRRGVQDKLEREIADMKAKAATLQTRSVSETATAQKSP